MCIRDRGLFQAERRLVKDTVRETYAIESNLFYPNKAAGQDLAVLFGFTDTEHLPRCLLYTSDAADERSSVDLGGRRIIKQKTI